MGVPLASRNLVQVSMNLTNFEKTPLHRAYDTVRAEAARHGVAIDGTEIVGLVPKAALDHCAEFGDQILENHLGQDVTAPATSEPRP
jgi:glutamate formiminotransferase